LGDTASLPPELLKQLSATRGNTDQDILSVIRADFGGTAAIDEILVSLYRKTGKFHERTPLYTRIYRMLNRGLLHPVPHRKGVCSVGPVN
jgi:hypothetical protein